MLLNRARLIKGLLLALVALAAREYAHYTYLTGELARAIVSSTEERPYVYRVLVPWLTWSLTRLGFTPETAITIVIVCLAIGLLYALLYLFHSFDRS